MPWESIGEVNTSGDESWVSFARDLAKLFIDQVCGDPPEDCELTTVEHDHDYGSYATLCVSYGVYQPQEYIRICQVALETFNQAVDWGMLREHYESVSLDADIDDNGYQ